MAVNLRIATWNANGIRSHIPELEVFLDAQKIDICLLSETHMTNQSFLKIRGYKSYNCIHPSGRAQGGASVLIREIIKHHEELQFCTEKIQAATVRIETKRYQCSVTAVYCPPRHKLSVEEYSNFLQSTGKIQYVMGGDWNAKNKYWGSRFNSPKGNSLLKAGKMLNCEFHSNGQPTHYPADREKKPDIIDFFITRGISNNYVSVEIYDDLSSDHLPIVLNLSNCIINKRPAMPSLVNKRTDWAGFKESLEENIQLNVPLKATDQLEKEAELFIELLQSTAKRNTPEIKTLNSLTLEKNFSLEVKELVLEKRKARRKWQNSKNVEDKNSFNRLGQQLKRLLFKIKNDGISNYLQQLTSQKETNYNLWKATKKIKRVVVNAPPVKKEDGTWARSSQEKADTHADHLENVFKPHPNESDHVFVPADYNGEQTYIKPVSPKEVELEIKQLNSKKSPGFDLVTIDMLKQLPRKAILKLTHLINASFRLKHVPKQWKIAEIITLPKPGKPPEQVGSFRPISLLPVVSKVFEKLLLKRLKPIIETENLLPSHQFGFRNKHSTIDQVHRITDDIEKALEDKKVCSAIFLDISQAFDKVWHEGLNHKLKQYLPESFSSILKSYLENRFFRVRYEDSFSSFRQILAGVPQGSILGPTLYLLYTSDIPKTVGTKMATFADDTSILATGINTRYATIKLQSAINKVHDWTKKWRIKLNEAKSQHINFTYRREAPLPVFMSERRVPYANTAKYLGMTLDARLNWKSHIKTKRKQLNTIYSKIKWLIGRSSKLALHNKLLLYKQIIKPIWTYGIQLWGCTKQSNIKVIQTFQNKVLRNMINAEWYIRNSDIRRDLGMDTVKTTIKSAASRHKERLLQHPNSQVTRLMSTPHDQLRRLKRIKPTDLLN